MYKTLVLFVTIMNMTNQACLNKDVLINLGYKPLDEPVLIVDPPICTKILGISKSCVDITDFENSVGAFKELSRTKKKQKYEELAKNAEKVNKHFKEMNKSSKEGKKFSGKKMSTKAKSELNSTFEFAPAEDEEINFEAEEESCMEAQIRMSIGSFCILISEKASEFVKEKENYDGVDRSSNNDVTATEGTPEKNLDSPLTLLVKDTSADEVVKECAQTIRAGCFNKKMVKVMTELDEEGKDVELDDGCVSEIVDCAENENCSDFTKKLVFEKNFNPFDDDLIDDDMMTYLEEGMGLFDRYEDEHLEKLGDKEEELMKLEETMFELEKKVIDGEITEEEKAELAKITSDWKVKSDELDKLDEEFFNMFENETKDDREKMKENMNKFEDKFRERIEDFVGDEFDKKYEEDRKRIEQKEYDLINEHDKGLNKILEEAEKLGTETEKNEFIKKQSEELEKTLEEGRKKLEEEHEKTFDEIENKLDEFQKQNEKLWEEKEKKFEEDFQKELKDLEARGGELSEDQKEIIKDLENIKDKFEDDVKDLFKSPDNINDIFNDTNATNGTDGADGTNGTDGADGFDGDRPRRLGLSGSSHTKHGISYSVDNSGADIVSEADKSGISASFEGVWGVGVVLFVFSLV